MIQPLFIFQSTPQCPGCHNNENTKVVCRNCNHEYTNGGYDSIKVVGFETIADEHDSLVTKKRYIMKASRSN